MDKLTAEKWTIPQYVGMCVLSVVVGVLFIADDGATAWTVIGFGLVAFGIGFGLIAAIAKASEVARTD